MKRKIIITGGTSGIGLATAKLFLQNRDQVMIVSRSKKKGLSALRKLQNFQDVYFCSADVRKEKDCEKIFIEAKKFFNEEKCDVLINSAGVYLEEAAENLSRVSYEKIFDTNVKGLMFVTKFALPFLKNAHGNIVNLSSDAGLRGNFNCSLYCASKGAVTLYTKALALDLASDGVRVNCVCPADVDTEMTHEQFRLMNVSEEEGKKIFSEIYPLKRIATAEEIAQVIYFLASDKASFVTGAAWSVDGGLTA